MEVFSRPEFRVDVLKVEVPINAEFVEGSAVFKGQKAYTREEACRHFREAAAMAAKPFIYLSAGVSNAQFTESLAIAGEAGTDYSGVLCGRATWKDGIPVYARQGLKALEEWLQRDGVRNIKAVNAGLQSACPWYAKLGISLRGLALAQERGARPIIAIPHRNSTSISVPSIFTRMSLFLNSRKTTMPHSAARTGDPAASMKRSSRVRRVSVRERWCTPTPATCRRTR